MPDWYFLGALAAAVAYLATRGVVRRRSQEAAADASGLAPVRDLTHLPGALQRDRAVVARAMAASSAASCTAWSRAAPRTSTSPRSISRRCASGAASGRTCPSSRRSGSAAWSASSSCEIDRRFPHLLLKRVGHGDDLIDDDLIERPARIAKAARDRLGIARSYPAELPPTLPPAPLVGRAPRAVARVRRRRDACSPTLVAAGFGDTLARAGRRDLVIELIDALVVVYPAARDVVGADAFADLTTTRSSIVDGVLASVAAALAARRRGAAPGVGAAPGSRSPSRTGWFAAARTPRRVRPMTSAMSKPTSLFLPAYTKLWIASIDTPELEVQAQYNPKELQIDKQVPWQPHKSRDNRPAGRRGERNPSQQADLEFNGAPTRSMTVELLFDGYEQGASVEPAVRRLEQLSSVRDPESSNPELRRPHHCVVAWGDQQSGMRPFRCVIASLATKYTMWDHAGTPLRATCTLKLDEAERMGRPPGEEKTRYHARDCRAYWERELARREEVQRKALEAQRPEAQQAAARREERRP